MKIIQIVTITVLLLTTEQVSIFPPSSFIFFSPFTPPNRPTNVGIQHMLFINSNLINRALQSAAFFVYRAQLFAMKHKRFTFMHTRKINMQRAYLYMQA